MTTLPLMPSLAQDAAALNNVWRCIDERSCPRQYNFHLHTLCSDGQLAPTELIEQATYFGVKGLAITDHHSVGGYLRAQRWLEEQESAGVENLPLLWTGIEINAQLDGSDVHILGYAFEPQHPSIQVYLNGQESPPPHNQAQQVIQAIHEAGGLAVLAHPERYRASAEDLVPLAAELGIDGAEAFYAYDNPKPWRPSPRQTKTVKALCDRYDLAATCGTDSHGPSLLSRI